jgi:plastocyanin
LQEVHKLRKGRVMVFLSVVLILGVSPGLAAAGKISGTVKTNGLRTPANVLVYLAEAPPVSSDLSKVKFVMDQRNLEFVPHVLPILVSSAVEFPNNDKVEHNVFSLSRTKQFNLGSYKAGESKTVVFDKPGIVELRCDVHAEMAAYILVLKNPYFALTDEKGHFEIPDSSYLNRIGLSGAEHLAAGKYLLKTWHEKLKTQSADVVVPENGDVTIQLDLNRGVPGVLYK